MTCCHPGRAGTHRHPLLAMSSTTCRKAPQASRCSQNTTLALPLPLSPPSPERTLHPADSSAFQHLRHLRVETTARRYKLSPSRPGNLTCGRRTKCCCFPCLSRAGGIHGALRLGRDAVGKAHVLGASHLPHGQNSSRKQQGPGVTGVRFSPSTSAFGSGGINSMG